MRANTKLCSFGYGLNKKSFDEKVIQSMIKELTVCPRNDFQIGQNNASVDDGSFCLCMETSKYLYLPKYFGLQKYGVPDDVQIREPKPIGVTFKGSLLKEQQAPVSEYLTCANDPKRMGGILQLPPGAGKTVMALYIICQLKVQTMIIVHKDFLLNQWKERIEQYVPDAKVGILRQKSIETKGYDITIASLQSLSMKDYESGTFDDFGMVVIDECHHIAAQVFSKALMKVNFKYALGLSATVQRKDGLSKVFKWFIGDIVFKVAKKASVQCQVDVAVYESNNPMYSQECYLFNGKINMAKMINNIASFAPRVDFVIDKLFSILTESPSRSVIMLSDRRQHLEDIKRCILKRDAVLGEDTGMYVGGMKHEDLEKSKEKKVILGTYNMVSEGFDLPRLDTLFLLTSKSDVTQSVGRVQRKHTYTDEDNIPLIVDIVDKFSVFENQYKKRLQFYRKMNYEIITNDSSKDNKMLFKKVF